jgi:predicted transcriptional regulator
MSLMKGNTIAVRLDDDLTAILDQVCRSSGRSKSEIIRAALKRHLALLRFQQLRRQTMPYAAAHGFLTDEDVFDRIS